MSSYLFNEIDINTIDLKAQDTIGCNTPGVYPMTLPAGVYQLECWGAQGGSYNTSYAEGGRGGYAIGTLTLKKTTTIYAYVGGQGAASSTGASTLAGGGFNGGGDAAYRGGGGGGGTDIRIGQDSLYARVIVSGGGGGAYAYSTTYKAAGGAGGGVNAVDGKTSSGTVTTYYGKAGTQTAGGASNTGVADSSNYNGKPGTFGAGGNTGNAYSTSYYSGGAGGGGWYGGSAAENGTNRNYGSGGGGGTGYVYKADTAANYPLGCLLDSQYYLTNTNRLNGEKSFTDYDGTTVTGHAGNGAIKITVVEIKPVIKNIFLKIATNKWVKLISENKSYGSGVLTNLVSAFSSSGTGWTASGGTKNESSTRLTITASSTTSKYVQLYNYYTVTAGHIYYVRATVQHNGSSNVGTPAEINISSDDESVWYINAPATGYTGSSTASKTMSKVGIINRPEIQYKLGSPTTGSGGTVYGTAPVYWSNVMLIDLTEAFGKGNEPTIEWCDANISYFTGSINVS